MHIPSGKTPAQPVTAANNATVAMMLTGICQVITRVITRNTPPARRSNALTSPKLPPIQPMSTSHVLGMMLSILPSPCIATFNAANGVAPVAASTYEVAKPCGTGHEVICAGNEISKNTRPTNAGLNKFCPNPPKVIFATPIATNAPITTIHQGKLLGKLNASNKPVNTADKSQMVDFCFNRYLVISHSNSTHAAMLIAVVIRAPQPNAITLTT